jgi:putative tryptophan/tyrosine transport system substrate-binding protein
MGLVEGSDPMTSRRVFIASGAATLALPAIAQGQQRRRRIAIMNAVRPVAELQPDGAPTLAAFHAELRRLGWREGENLATEYWSALGRTDRDQFVREVYASRPDVVFASGYVQFTDALLRHANVPTVIFGQDPVRTGAVTSLARPEGQITGFSSDAGIELATKRLQLLVECIPKARRVAYYGADYTWSIISDLMRANADHFATTLEPALIGAGASEVESRRVFASMAATRPDGVLLGVGIENLARSSLISELALDARLPAIGYERVFAEAGMLLSYGPDFRALNRGCAQYVDRILRGAKPGDLPVQQPTVFEFILNLKTAKALGIEIPFLILARADEVIE